MLVTCCRHTSKKYSVATPMSERMRRTGMGVEADMRRFSRERIGFETTPSSGRLPLFSAARRASRSLDRSHGPGSESVGEMLDEALGYSFNDARLSAPSSAADANRPLPRQQLPLPQSRSGLQSSIMNGFRGNRLTAYPAPRNRTSVDSGGGRLKMMAARMP